MPIAITDDQRAVADAVREWAGKAAPVATARSQELAIEAWRKHWADLAALGMFAAAIPDDCGGAGGAVVDLAVMLEAAAAALAPGPVAPTALAALVLARSGSAQARELLARIVSGAAPAAVALSGDGLSARRSADGVVVTGTSEPLVGAVGDSLLVLAAQDGDRDVWFVLDAADTDGMSVTDVQPADFSRSLATVGLHEVAVPSARLLDLTTDAVQNLAATVFAAEAAGVADWCLRTAVDYAKVREQFGAPIGSFQAVKHLCAEMLLRVEQSAAVAWDAAVAADATDGDDQHRVAAAVAAAIALDGAVETAKDCIQVLGGIGFTWEHDAHLYLRRAVALRQVLGGTSRWRARVAELTLAGARRELHIDLGVDADEERASVRAAAQRIAALPDEQQRIALADAGYLAPHWPAPFGLDASAAEQLLIDQELAHAGVHRPDLVIGAWAIPTILQTGTQEQKDRFVTATLRGEITWCQLFSEPGAGSDLAGLRTRAERVEGGWRLYGQKVWTSVAHRADWGICLARTNPAVPKHKGISYFLIDMRSEGLDIRPLREITGEAMFNEVFFDGVFVPDELVVGDVDDGWKLARATLVNERIAMSGGGGLDGELEAVLRLGSELGREADHEVRRTLGGLISVSLSAALLDVRSTLRQLDGRDVSALSSVRKLIGVRHRQAVAEAGLELLGAAGAQAGDQLQSFLMTRCLTIAGGTSQVLLTLAAERILGLPRS